MSRQVNYAEPGVPSPPVLSLPSPVCPRGYRPHQERGTIEYAGAEGEYILWRVWEDDVRVIQGITPWQFRTRAARSASGAILVELYIHARRAGWHWVYPNPRKPGELYCKGGCPTWPVCKHVRLARAHLDLLAGTVIPCVRCGVLMPAEDCPPGTTGGTE